jgi:cyclophilin family peptidyl-prolyl cis-trans isomerase
MTRHRHVAAALAALAVQLLIAACSRPGGVPTIPPATPTPAATEAPEATHPGPTYPPGCPSTQPAALTADDVRTVTITTALGDIVIRVEGGLSPIATGNFVALAVCGYYDNVVFHRLVPGFVIQGGDGQFGRSPDIIPSLMGTGGPPYTIADEPVTTAYARGTVAMARSELPNSVGSQFFIVLEDAAASALADPRYNNYQIIGTVTSGMDAVDAIAAMPNSGQDTGNKALEPVPMTSVTVGNP